MEMGLVSTYRFSLGECARECITDIKKAGVSARNSHAILNRRVGMTFSSGGGQIYSYAGDSHGFFWGGGQKHNY